MAKDKKSKGVSLAKGPVALIGLALLAFGILALIFGDRGFTVDIPSGDVDGEQFLGVEVNGWSSLLFIGAGALLVFGAPTHWGAKGLSLIVGLALGAASVIAIVDKRDVFGIFAANGLTKLIWGVAAAVLTVLALLPRIGGRSKKKDDGASADQPRPTRRVEREPKPVEREPRFERDTVGDSSRSRRQESSVVAPASGTTPESRETTRRQRDN